MLKPLRLSAAAAMLALAFAAVSSFADAGAAWAQAGKVEPARLAAAKALMDVTGAAQRMEALLPMMMQQIEASFVKLKPEAATHIHEVFRRMPEKFSARKQELLDQIAELYARQFTTEELNGVTEFFSSPLGKKFTAQQTALMQQSMLLGNSWGQKIGQEIAEELRNELQQRGVKL